jgi:hypothetical protein
MVPGVGAVGGAVVTPGQKNDSGSGKLIDIFDHGNLQWVGDDPIAVAVEHLHSTFLYRAGIVNYNLALSPVAHREETMFSHDLFRAGYELVVDTTITTHHLRRSGGGIREHKDETMYQWDEKIFWNYLKEKGTRIVLLDNGLGDHYAFKKILIELKEKYRDVVIACCFPDVFRDCGVRLISIAQSGQPQYENVYGWMKEKKWTQSLVDAFRAFYLEEW